MSENKPNPLEKRLNNWKVSLERDPALVTHVLNRVAAEKQARTLFSRSRAIRWAGGFAAGVALLVGVFFISQQLERNRHLTEGEYALLIDPVFRVHAKLVEDHSINADTLVDRLAWMQDRLDLSQEQFLELVDLHESYSDRFDSIYSELLRLENRYAQFEVVRKQNGMIDFIALYEVLSERKEAEGDSNALSREFISKVASLLGPGQRASYLSLVQNSATPDA